MGANVSGYFFNSLLLLLCFTAGCTLYGILFHVLFMSHGHMLNMATRLKHVFIKCSAPARILTRVRP